MIDWWLSGATLWLSVVGGCHVLMIVCVDGCLVDGCLLTDWENQL